VILQGRVVSGHTAALDVVQEAAVKKGALKAARLAVSGAFHTPLMQPARDALVKVQPPVSQPPCGNTYACCMRNPQHLYMYQPDAIMQNISCCAMGSLVHMLQVLAGVTFNTPRIPVYSNVTAALLTSAADIPAMLARQLVEPVQVTEAHSP
jgi:[acyl-carrier-protein] S-malonyltransferase